MNTPKQSRAKAIVIGVIAVVILVPSAFGFITKLVEFYYTFKTEKGGGFAIFPIMNYLLITAGFACLLGWATFNGMFRNIEKPKYDMLEQEDRLERDDPTLWDPPARHET